MTMMETSDQSRQREWLDNANAVNQQRQRTQNSTTTIKQSNNKNKNKNKKKAKAEEEEGFLTYVDMAVLQNSVGIDHGVMVAHTGSQPQTHTNTNKKHTNSNS